MLGCIIILIGVGLYIFVSPKLKNQSTMPPTLENEQPASQESTQPSDELLAGGSGYIDPSGVFSILYPNDWKIDNQNNGQVTRVYKTGVTQRGQTEMYDGIIITFELFDLKGASLSNWLDAHIKEISVDGMTQITKPKKAITLNTFPGFSYTTRGLGEFNTIIVQKDTKSPYAIQVTSLVADPQNIGYQKEVDDVLSSLKLLK